MHRSSTLRRSILAAALAILTLLVTAPTGGHASPLERTPRAVSTRICGYDWSRSIRQVKLLIRCAAHRWKVPGGPVKALAVAQCESGFRPEAYNPGGYAGVYQQAVRYWPERSRTFGFPDRSVFNGRANVIVSVRMAHAERSWSDWGCA